MKTYEYVSVYAGSGLYGFHGKTHVFTIILITTVACATHIFSNCLSQALRN
jgi:hypothetical protein